MLQMELLYCLIASGDGEGFITLNDSEREKDVTYGNLKIVIWKTHIRLLL